MKKDFEENISDYQAADIAQPPVPRWIRPVIYGQLTLALVLIASGIGDIAAKGYLANIGTGVYSGFAEILAAACQLYLLRNNAGSSLGLCKFTLALALILCTVDVPLVAVLSIIMGDANGYPRKFCRYHGPISDFLCIIVTNAPNVGALLCDCIQILAGLASGCLLLASGTYILPLSKNSCYPNIYAA